MTTQTIPDTENDHINDVVPEQWQKGVCPPPWAEPTILLFQGVALSFQGALLAFKDY